MPYILYICLSFTVFITFLCTLYSYCIFSDLTIILVHQLTLFTVFSYLLTYLLTVFSVRYLAFGLLYFNKRIVEVTVIVFHSTFINTQDAANLRHITDFEQSQGGPGRHTNRPSDRRTDESWLHLVGRIMITISRQVKTLSVCAD